MKKEKRIIVWFRKDLRLHDNEVLTSALEHCEELIPIFVFDNKKLLSNNEFNLQKTGIFRANFLLESVANLQANLQAKGINLIIRQGNPEEEVFKLVQETGATGVYANMERTQHEVAAQNALEKKLWSIGLEISFFRGKMLYYTQDLPFPIAHTPDTFANFRKEVERFILIREPLPTPDTFNPWTIDIEAGKLPQLSDFGHQTAILDKLPNHDFRGGESCGLEHLKQYFETDNTSPSNEIHLELAGNITSSYLSPWLALGCISPKKVYSYLKNYEKDNKATKSSQSFFLGLLWRDYCRLLGKKFGDKIFEVGGIKGLETKELSNNLNAFQQWVEGNTSSDLINACMLQLQSTGYLSARGRQLVSSYLVNDLEINWQMGAAYFQHILIDYDICSNWVNWNIVGGVGLDPKDDRYISIENQAKRLDPKGSYTDLWLKKRTAENSL